MPHPKFGIAATNSAVSIPQLRTDLGANLWYRFSDFGLPSTTPGQIPIVLPAWTDAQILASAQGPLQIAGWILGNEPNIGAGHYQEPPVYVAWVNHVIALIRSVVPGALFVGPQVYNWTTPPGFGFTGRDFSEQCLALWGGVSPFACWSVHTYANAGTGVLPTQDAAHDLALLQEVRTWMQSHQAASAGQLWVTEFGSLYAQNSAGVYDEPAALAYLDAMGRAFWTTPTVDQAFLFESGDSCPGLACYHGSALTSVGQRYGEWAKLADPTPRLLTNASLETPDTLLVTVWFPTAANCVQRLDWAPATNATISLDGYAGATPYSHSYPDLVKSVQFRAHRVTPGQAMTVPFTITDCVGAWPTFVGQGP